jgi:hypothetical protein
MFRKSIIKNPTCFGHYCMAILRCRPLYLVFLLLFDCLLRYLPFRYVAVCLLCVCVSGVPVCGVSDRARSDNPQTGTPDTHTQKA